LTAKKAECTAKFSQCNAKASQNALQKFAKCIANTKIAICISGWSKALKSMVEMMKTKVFQIESEITTLKNEE
jgi:hypothetical protein